MRAVAFNEFSAAPTVTELPVPEPEAGDEIFRSRPAPYTVVSLRCAGPAGLFAGTGAGARRYRPAMTASRGPGFGSEGSSEAPDPSQQGSTCSYIFTRSHKGGARWPDRILS
jgi:hypothetical protein